MIHENSYGRQASNGHPRTGQQHVGAVLKKSSIQRAFLLMRVLSVVFVLMLDCFGMGLIAIADTPAVAITTHAAVATPAASSLRFSFSGTSWREVLSWLAEESQLALHVGALPPGSFTYEDPNAFTIDEAIARLNLFLIPQGYTIVRRDQLLSVLSLSDPRSLQQLDALASVRTVDQLHGLSEHEIIKCSLPIGDLVADEVVAELKPLMLMNPPVVLPRSKQIVVTETAGKVRSVLQVIEAMTVPAEEMLVRRFELRHTDYDAVMLVAVAHLGLTTGELTSEELSISSDATGKLLFVSGLTDKVERLDSLLKVLDVPAQAASSTANMTLKSHSVAGDNLQAVYDVLQTILTGKDVRISMQASTRSIVALADDETQGQIERTIAELQAPAVEFAIIPLGSADPYFVVSLISEMFVPPTEEKGKTTEPPLVPAPRVDADPGNRRLFVRGTMDQVTQIRKMVESLDRRVTGRESVRVLPVPPQTRQQILEAAAQQWRGSNRVDVLPTRELSSNATEVIERTLHSDSSISEEAVISSPSRPTATSQTSPAKPSEDVLSMVASVDKPTGDDGVCLVPSNAVHTVATRNNDSSTKDDVASPIRSRLVPEGILIESDDVEALDEFQSHLMDTAAIQSRTPSPPVVYYLKYVSADDAVKMLADLLDGGQSLADVPGESLVNGGRTSALGDSFAGSFLLKREGMMTITAGTATVVSDARLNRLIVQGTAQDVSTIEGYLKIIDKGTSLTSIETAGKAHVIELVHTKASDVAEAIKQAYATRIANNDTNRQANQRGNDREERDPRQANNNSDSDRGRGNQDGQREVDEKPTRGRQAEMTVAVHEPSNSLIITAPDALFAEVESLVKRVDMRSEQDVQVIPVMVGVDPELMLKTLGVDIGTSTSDRPSSSNASSTGSRSSGSSGSR